MQRMTKLEYLREIYPLCKLLLGYVRHGRRGAL